MDKKLISLSIGLLLPTLTAFSAESKEAKPPGAIFELCNESLFTESECNKWIREMTQTLPIMQREQGPFGLSQNPGEVKVENVINERDRAFEKAIDSIPITAVHPAEDKFIVGSGEYVEGNVIPLVSGSRKFMAKIVSVKADGILFQNLKTGEQINKNLAKVKGVAPIRPIRNLPGVVPNSPNHTAPIILNN